MITKTKGIVLKTIKYGDASAITKIFTEEFGLIGFHVPSLFKNKGKIKPSHLQALNCIETETEVRSFAIAWVRPDRKDE